MRFLNPWLLPYLFGFFKVVVPQLSPIDIYRKVFKLHIDLIVVELFLSEEIVFEGVFRLVESYQHLHPFVLINFNFQLVEFLLKVYPPNEPFPLCSNLVVGSSDKIIESALRQQFLLLIHIFLRGIALWFHSLNDPFHIVLFMLFD